MESRAQIADEKDFKGYAITNPLTYIEHEEEGGYRGSKNRWGECQGNLFGNKWGQNKSQLSNERAKPKPPKKTKNTTKKQVIRLKHKEARG